MGSNGAASLTYFFSRPERRRRSASARGTAGGATFGRSRRGGCGCGCGGSSGFRSRFQLFRVARRRHDGDQGLIGPADHAHVRRQLDLVEVLGIVDLQPADIDIDRFRDGIGRAHHLDRVGDDVDGAAALHAGRLIGMHHVHRDAHADLGAFGEPQEIHMHRQIAHRIELEVARDNPVLGALDVEIVDRGEEAARIDAVLELIMVDRDGERGLVVAVDDAGHAPGPTLGPRGPLAGLRTRGRLQISDSRHDTMPLCPYRVTSVPDVHAGCSYLHRPNASAAMERAALSATTHLRRVIGGHPSAARLQGCGGRRWRRLIAAPGGIDKETACRDRAYSRTRIRRSPLSPSLSPSGEGGACGARSTNR